MTGPLVRAAVAAVLVASTLPLAVLATDADVQRAAGTPPLAAHDADADAQRPAGTPPLATHGADADAQRAAISRLRFMVGTWQATGWVLRGTERVEFHGTDEVGLRLDGTVLTFDGVHHGAGERVVHGAFAVITYDPDAQKYRMLTYLLGGKGREVDARVVGRNVVAEFEPATGMRARVTIEPTANGWREHGERSTDGGRTWIPTFAIDLRRRDRPTPASRGLRRSAPTLRRSRCEQT